MSELEKKSKPKAIYEPGELDRVRKNLGEMTPEEARLMAQTLGGEVGVEKAPMYDDFSKSRGIYITDRERIHHHHHSSSSENEGEHSSTTTKRAEASREIVKKVLTLPPIPQKEKNLIDKLMIDYKIKRPQGFFAMLFSLGKSGDKVSEDFISKILLNYIGHFQKFVSCVKRIVVSGSEDYKAKVRSESNSLFKFLNYISNYDLSSVRDLYRQLEKEPEDVTVAKMIPFIKIFYKPLIILYFIGEKKVIENIKIAYSEILPNSQVKEDELLQYTKEAASEWIVVYEQVIRGLYPLLLRMCGTEFVEYPKFFSLKIPKILVFLNMTKFDLILSERKKKKNDKSDTVNEESSRKEVKEEVKEPEPPKDLIPATVKQGVMVLEKLFPGAGWEKLTKGVDLFPYFQPLYQFADGFNLISPKNPMHVTIVLIRILEDLLQGCRHIQYSIDKEEIFNYYSDSLSDVFNEWGLYREVIFEKEILKELKDYVNHIYTQSDFKKQPYAKKQMTNLLWKERCVFLPYLSFELLFIERQKKLDSDIPLSVRVDYLKVLFSTLVSRFDGGAEGIECGAGNLKERYHFDLPNVVSKRIDVLLGGKKSKNLTNINLLKYTLCVIYVLDWWINTEHSPAYTLMNDELPYRVSSENGTPVFSVPLRKDQNELFVRSIKARVNAASAASDRTTVSSDDNSPVKKESPAPAEDSASKTEEISQ